MGGDQRKTGQDYDPVLEDLVYRTEGTGEAEKNYSDDYTRQIYANQKKERDELIEALSRLGVLDQLLPKGMTPRMPYRTVEQEFGF